MRAQTPTAQTPTAPRRASTSSGGDPGPGLRHQPCPMRADLAAASALELRRATLVAVLMGLDPSWAASTSDKPAWWLEAWARQLAAEQLPRELGAELMSWITAVQRALAEREEHLLLAHAAPGSQDRRHRWLPRWLRLARALDTYGAELEGFVEAALAVRDKGDTQRNTGGPFHG